MTIHFQHLPITAKTVRILGMILILFLFSSLTVRQAQAAPLLQTGCTLPATVTTTNELSDCITEANANGAGLDTITLGANITLSAALPQITTAITIEGAGYFIDGADTYRMFSVGSTGDFTINQATLQNGYSGGNGGAIENLGVLTVNRSTLSSNTAFFAGGGINNAGTLTIIHSTISGNTTNITGGGGISNSGPLTVTNSTFSGNTAAGSGGAIYNYETPLTVTNSTFSGNSAPSGGAIFGQYTNSTLNLAGNIFVTGANGANCANGGVVVDNGYNLSNDATCTNGGFGSQTNATLNLGPLANNGGLTPTHLPGAGSAAIGAIPFGYVGNNNGVLMACNQTTTDQIGQSRPITSNIACTSGAVEATSTSLTIIKDASPAIGADFDFTINSTPLTSYSGTTSGKPFWTRPNEGTTCTLSANSVRYHVQAFVVDTSGTYDLSSQQNGWNGYIHLYQDGFNPLAPCANYLNGDDNALSSSSSEIISFLEAGRAYFFVTSGNFSTAAGNFTNYISGPGNAYTLYESFTLDDAVPDDSDGVNASTTFAVKPGTYAVTEAGLSGWGLTGATCTGASGSVSLTGDTLSVQVSNGEAVQCTFTNETLCPASGTVTSAAELSACIVLANANENPSPTADTITLGADITLTTALPQITSEITLEGANHFVDGGNSVRIFNVSTAGNFSVNQSTLQNGVSTTNGGGIDNRGTLTVTNSTISRNSAYIGGGIYNNGTLMVADSTFSGNSGDFGGGIYNNGTLTVADSTFSDNTVDGYGGAVSNNDGTVTVTNSTFSGNVATVHGGGIINWNGPLTVTNSTFSDNTADGYGGGIINDAGTVHLAGNVFAAGLNGDNCVNYSSTITDNGYNLSDDASCGFSGAGSVNNATLNLSALSVTTTPGQQVHTPQLGSDAIGVIPNGTTISNNGSSWTCNQTTTDQLGADRPITALTACTAGAVEVEMPPICPAWTVTTAAELSECITLANNNESPSPAADTITLGADINLATALPQITSEITLEGANHFVDGGNNVRIFNVGTTGTFYVNQATLQNGSAIVGGGINNSGTLTVTDSTFSRNGGAGIYNGGTLTVANSTFSDNWDGSGIINDGTLTVTDSTFSNNIAEGGGGITNNGTLTVTNSTFSGNLASYDGGGIYNGLGKTATLINSTFSGNGAGDSGSGVYNRGTVHLAGTIFADRTSSNNCFNFGGTLIDNGYNLSDDASCGFSGTGSANNATLNLSALSVTTTPGQQVHTPQAGSDAIGVIPNGTTVNNNGITLACNQTTTDQLGANRPINGGDNCTSGAVEVTPICTSWTVTTAAELSECITLANANESPSPTADTITLGADINLSTVLPQISSEITLEGASHFIDGGDNVQLFYVTSTSDFTVNQATLQNGSAADGGGIYNDGTLTLTNSTISGNSVIYDGGGIYNNGMLAVTNSTISGNSAIYEGGGIFNFGTVTVSNSTFSNNSNLSGGGIGNYGSLTVIDSTFSGNTATTNGGGVSNRGTLTVTNSTFSGNRADNNGGGIYNRATATVTNSTFSSNRADLGLGGGIYNNSGTAHLAGTIFANSPSGDNCNGIFTDNGYNLSDDASCGFSGTSADNATLNLGALADNGGPTQTHLPGAGSDAIGAIPYGTTINNNGVTLACNQTTTDQLGANRPINLLTGCTAGAAEVAISVCPSWTATTADELYQCISRANNNESPSPTADTITLGADIDLTTLTISPLPQITSAITLQGANHVIDGGWDSVPGSGTGIQLFYVTSAGNFTVIQATLQNGEAADGGGVYNQGTLTVTNSTISGNTAGFGGGVYNAIGTLTVTNSTISGNTTTGYGGGVYNRDTLTVTNSTISGNAATSYGGGIYNSIGTLTVTNSTISGNTASGGGGIYVRTGSITVTNSTISGNTASDGGGVRNNGTLTVTNSTISGNTATGYGGGVYNYDTATVTNSTLSGNSASDGGGIYNNLGTAHLAGSIFAAGSGGDNCTNSGTLNDNGYNLSDDASCGFSGTSVDNATLNLGDLADNGGPTWTHALLPGSDAIDAIPGGSCLTATDQRGVARPVNGSCDSGAYEAGTLVCSVSADNTYTFPQQSGVAIYVESETDLECLYVEEMPFSHPNATGAGEGQALRTGKYWRIRALQDASGTTANNYVANLTLPHNNLNNPQACKYTGGAGYGWECAADASTSSTVTRNGLTSFSDWAVGGDVGPTAVSLQSLSVTSNRQAGVWLAVLVMGLVTAVGLWRRRTGQSF